MILYFKGQSVACERKESRLTPGFLACHKSGAAINWDGETIGGISLGKGMWASEA